MLQAEINSPRVSISTPRAGVTVRESVLHQGRAIFDWQLLQPGNGWFAIRFEPDAPRVGAWLNPSALQIFCIAGSDTKATFCTGHKALVGELEHLRSVSSGWRGIDPGPFRADRRALIGLEPFLIDGATATAA